MQNASLGIITDENRNVLLVLRKDVPFWVLPGGGIEQNELSDVACRREVCEETGLLIEHLTHIATYSPINALASTTYIYSGKIHSSPALHVQAHEVAGAEFFPLGNLPANIFFIHRLFLKDWQEASSYPFLRSLTEVSYKKAVLFFCKHPISSLRYLWTRITNSFS
jgi:8-oxo-dGTP diphosphatase